jgi:import inner membrane translocase subunit TIM22
VNSQMQALMESCPGKTAVSGVMGFFLGGAFGLFMASVRSMSHSALFTAHNSNTAADAI